MNTASMKRLRLSIKDFIGRTTSLILILISTNFLSNAHAGDLNINEKNKYLRITSDGEYLRPDNYRHWVYIGGSVTPNDLNGGKALFPGFHNVYIDPISFDTYQKTAKLPQGTILLKEQLSVGERTSNSGNGYFMGDFVSLAAAVKSKKHFPNEPGNWAYFAFGAKENLRDKAKAFPAATCNTCHSLAANKDYSFTEFYPILTQMAPGKNKLSTSNEH